MNVKRSHYDTNMKCVRLNMRKTNVWLIAGAHSLLTRTRLKLMILDDTRDTTGDGVHLASQG